MSRLGRRRATRSGSCSITSTSCPASWRSEAMNVPTFPAPAIITRTFPSPSLGRLRAGQEPTLELVEAVLAGGDVQQVALLAHDVAGSQPGSAGPGDGDQPDATLQVDAVEPLAGPVLGQRPLDEHQLAAGVGPLGDGGLREEPTHHLLGRPGHRGHRGDAEALVDDGPAGVVDPGDDVRGLVGLPGDPGREDVRVVPARDRSQGARVPDSGQLQVVPVESEAHDRPPRPLGRQPAQRPRVLVDDRHAVAVALQIDGELRPDSTAAHDHDVHGSMEHGPGTAHNSPLHPRGPRGPGQVGAKCLLGDMRSAAPRIDRRAPAALPTPESLELPESLGYRIKKRLLGPPLVSEQLRTERLGRPTALAILSSDVLSSSAYATEQILRVLVVAVGVAAFSLTVPVTLAILVVLAFVTLSYREVIWAYPKAGGAYVVSRQNFGPNIAQIAGVPLLIDYTLTVAVSMAAGVSALTSAVPSLTPYTVEMAVAFVILMAYGNLRGIRDVGRTFALPTCLFFSHMALL